MENGKFASPNVGENFRMRVAIALPDYMAEILVQAVLVVSPVKWNNHIPF